MGKSTRLGLATAALWLWAGLAMADEPVLPGTALEAPGDLAMDMVAGIDAWLMAALDASVAARARHWNRDLSSPAAYATSVDGNRARFRTRIGVVDERLPHETRLMATLEHGALLAGGAGYRVYAVQWPVLEGVAAEGLLLEPDAAPRAQVVALGDCDWTPEQFAGLAPGLPAEAQWARRLAEDGCRVVVPVLLDRSSEFSGNPAIRMVDQSHREFIYRLAYEMGRHVIGYEVQAVLAAVDGFAAGPPAPTGVIGYGEGGLIAFYAAAVDTRIDAAAVSGYFQPRERVWAEPIERNVWALLDEFGDAEIASLVAPRRLIVDAAPHPAVSNPPLEERRGTAAPGVIETPSVEAVRQEVDRARALVGLDGVSFITVAEPDATLGAFLAALSIEAAPDAAGAPDPVRPLPDARARMKRWFDALAAHTQRLMRESPQVRDAFFADADAASPETWAASVAPYRAYFWDEVIGKLPEADRPANPRTRRIYDTPAFTGHEVVLDVYDTVFAYGILLVPKDIAPGERRPVVVCQHGLEGRPRELCDPEFDSPYYHRYGARLAERGFIVYAPQNPYIGGTAFRQLQRKANPLKLSLFSFIVRQHERTLEWLGSFDFVDPGRIAFYGLSYGGKTAMRVPALLDGYCLSICSGDFNEWIWKMVSLDQPFTYPFTHEYEMYEFDLGNTFNYAEMATLIFPRPFMVERGHRDGVSVDEWVAYEYAKVRRFYDEMGLGDRTEIEYFNGPHEIHGEGTFAFLHRHLGWPAPVE